MWTAGFVALAPLLPGFLARTARAAASDRDGRVLVVVQLSGGNDGLNTVVPYHDEGYAKYRKALRLPAGGLIKVADGLALHPSLGPAAALLEEGQLAIVQGVGYPNPSRSHFRSMAVWHSARFEAREHAVGLGWIGRALDDGRRPSDGSPDGPLIGTEAPPPAMRGRRSNSAALDRLDDYEVADPFLGRSAAAADDLGVFLRRTAVDAYATADRLHAVRREGESGERYPDGELSRRLKLVARLLKAGLGTRVYYIEHDGSDTHGDQLPTHAALLGELSASVRSFLGDLAGAKQAERVLVLIFSEFGRRVQENATLGTDHGTAGPVLLAGPGVRTGLVGTYPTPRGAGGEEGPENDGGFCAGCSRRSSGAGSGSPAKGCALGGNFEPLPGFWFPESSRARCGRIAGRLRSEDNCPWRGGQDRRGTCDWSRL